MAEASTGNGSKAAKAKANGRIVRVIGPVVDVEFPPDDLPEIDFALTVERTLDGETSSITCEVAQHVGDNIVRAIAMRPTDGVVRGAPVVNTGQSMTVPVGEATLGHVFNVLGQPLDTDRVDWVVVNVGSDQVAALPTFGWWAGASSAVGAGRGGVPVVVRARERRAHGEGHSEAAVAGRPGSSCR